jgi:hypothetical protein
MKLFIHLQISFRVGKKSNGADLNKNYNCRLHLIRKRKCRSVDTRVARWHIFKPKIPLWVNFGVSCNERRWNILLPFGLFISHFVYFVAIFYGYLLNFFTFWYIVPRKIWQLWWTPMVYFLRTKIFRA